MRDIVAKDGLAEAKHVRTLLGKEVLKVKGASGVVVMGGKVAVEMTGKVAPHVDVHVPEDIVLKLPEQIVKVEVEISGLGMEMESVVTSLTASVVLFAFVLVRQDLIS